MGGVLNRRAGAWLSTVTYTSYDWEDDEGPRTKLMIHESMQLLYPFVCRRGFSPGVLGVLVLNRPLLDLMRPILDHHDGSDNTG